MRRAALLFLAAFVLLPVAAGAEELKALDGIVRDYQNALPHWFVQLGPHASRLFALLATLEICWAAIAWALNPAHATLGGLLRKALLLGILFAAVQLYPFWLPAVVKSFEVAGQSASAEPTLNPSDVVGRGIHIGTALQLRAASFGLLAHPAALITSSFTSLIVIIAYIAIAAQLVLALTETAIVLATGPFWLAFAAFRGTAQIADNFLAYALHVGIKIFFLYLLVAVGVHLTSVWADYLLLTIFDPFDLTIYSQILAGALVLAFLVWRIPGDVASRLSGGVGFRIREALSE
jgi:type IV secretion system protein TrbL